MSRGTVESTPEERDPRRQVYDMLKGLDETSKSHVIRLFVMAGQKGMVGGYFFEKDSADYLNSIGQVEVSDAEGNVVGRLHQSQVFYAFHVSPPEWLQEGKTYNISQPQVSEDQFSKLWKIKDGILKSLRYVGMDAAREFHLLGTAMGGEAEDNDEVAKNIASRISKMIDEAGENE